MNRMNIVHCIMILISLLVTACGETSQVIIQGETVGKEEIQTFEIDNCTGKADIPRTEMREQSVDVTISAEVAQKIGTTVEILSAEAQVAVGTAIGRGDRRSTQITVSAPPGTRMAFQLTWIGTERIGTVQYLYGSPGGVFRAFTPTDVRIKSQYDIGCPSTNAPVSSNIDPVSTVTNVPIQKATDTPQPISTPIVACFGQPLPHHPPIVGQPWVLPEGGWIIVNFWSNEPGVDQTEHKLLLAPNDPRAFLGGGSAWRWSEACEGDARINLQTNPLPEISLEELRIQNLVQ